MKNYYNELNKIIVLAAIANAAEEAYSENSASEAAERAFDEAYKAVEGISFEKAHYRHDIGARALKAL